MSHFTDSGGNYFVGSSLDQTWATFIADLGGCFTAALGSNYAANIPTLQADAGQLRIEWRPQGVGDSLSGTITLNSTGQPLSLYRHDFGILNTNARFGLFPFSWNTASDGSAPIRNIAGTVVNSPMLSGGTSSFVPARFMVTMSNREMIFFTANSSYSNYLLAYQGVTQGIVFPFAGSHPKGSVSWAIFNAGSSVNTGYSIWTDSSARSLLTSAYTLACSTESGLTYGSNLWMTDLMFRFDASVNNNTMIGTAKNLKIATGASVTVGNLYRKDIGDSGSDLWLCVASITQGKLMMRVKT